MVNVVEIEKESISRTVTTLLRHVYDHMETRLKPNSRGRGKISNEWNGRYPQLSSLSGLTYPV